MKPGRIVALVIGSIVALIGLAMLIGALALGIVYATQRDDDGFFTTDDVRIESPTAAIRSERIDLGSDERPDRWPFGDGDLATVRLQAEPPEGQEIFIGIGHTDDVDAFLGDARHDEIHDIDWGDDDPEYRRRGSRDVAVAPPVDQDFWVASAAGDGPQSLTWDVQGGHWSIVAMRPDGTPGVGADVSIGLKIDALIWIIVGVAIGGALLLALAVALIIWAAKPQPAESAPEAVAAEEPPPAPAGAAPPGAGRSPVRLEARLDEKLSRWLWLVKWFLAIPHWFVLVFLWIAFVIVSVIAFFAILFTGRYPRGLFRFNVGVMRWTWRVSYYATSGVGTDRYPPFSLATNDYPATLDVEYPERLSRGLVLVKWWLLAIPHYIVVGFFVGGGWWTGGWDDDDGWRTTGGPGLIGVLTIVAGVALLFTARYPRRLFDFVIGMNRWVYRTVAYAALMTDRYPPFALDQGPTENDGEAPAPPTSVGDDTWPPPPPAI